MVDVFSEFGDRARAATWRLDVQRVGEPGSDREWAIADQERSCALVAATGDADLLKWAQLHADIIRRFGRFPHRNAMLGRATTPEEQAFLDGGGFKG